MTEYIDKGAFIQDIETEIINLSMDSMKGTRMPHDELYQFIERIKAQPAAEVAPMVHARWLDEDFPEEMATVHGFAICSACGELSHKAEHGYNILSEYCPHCGAKMDLKDLEG